MVLLGPLLAIPALLANISVVRRFSVGLGSCSRSVDRRLWYLGLFLLCRHYISISPAIQTHIVDLRCAIGLWNDIGSTSPPAFYTGTHSCCFLLGMLRGLHWQRASGATHDARTQASTSVKLLVGQRDSSHNGSEGSEKGIKKNACLGHSTMVLRCRHMAEMDCAMEKPFEQRKVVVSS